MTEPKEPFLDWKMKPMMILPPKAMSDECIAALRENGLCVVVAENPSAIKFVDPIPAISSRTEIEQAAIRFSRKIMAPGYWQNDETRATVCRLFVDMLVSGTPLDPNGTRQEQEDRIVDTARRDELQRIAREEARAEQLARKAARAKEKKA